LRRPAQRHLRRLSAAQAPALAGAAVDRLPQAPLRPAALLDGGQAEPDAMILESILAFLHISAILALVVFITSEAAICRPEWMNKDIVERLVTVDRIYGIAALAVLATGLLRVYLGVKGEGWYWGNWLLHLKITLFVV